MGPRAKTVATTRRVPRFRVVQAARHAVTKDSRTSPRVPGAVGAVAARFA